MAGTRLLPTGTAAPPFALPGTDGRTHALDELAHAKALAVVFWCNHCPYVQAYEDRVLALGRRYAPELAMVLINSNETKNYPEDSFDRMVERAKGRGYPVPYLRDESQAVATAYHAQCTPHAFVFDAARRLVYQGAIDDNYRDAKAARTLHLHDAIQAALEGRSPPTDFAHPIGCSIKWG